LSIAASWKRIWRLGKGEGREFREELSTVGKHSMKDVFVLSQDILKIS
jgi:hypothetical protein